MKRIALNFLVCTLLLLLLCTAIDLRTTRANSQTTYGHTCVSYVPAEWGEFKGGNQQSGLAFQERTATLHFVTHLPCDGIAQPALEIRRTAPKQNYGQTSINKSCGGPKRPL